MSMCLDRAPRVLDGICDIPSLEEFDFGDYIETTPDKLQASHESCLFVVHYTRLARTGEAPSHTRNLFFFV